MSAVFPPAFRPTMYFIGVTTRHSSINAVFPVWAKRLGRGDVELRGWDFPLHDRPEHYRAAVEFIKRDPQSLGALVTTHKLDLYAACHDLFDELDPLTRSLGEVSSIYKRDGRLHGRAVDPWTVGHALDAFLSRGHWRSGAEALILGAGGAGTALAWQLNSPRREGDRPRRIQIVDRSAARIAEVRRLGATWREMDGFEGHVTSSAAESDALVTSLPPGSLVVNATGAGKDTPGSPLGGDAIFPERGIAWDFNYRGDLAFLDQARAQSVARGVQVEDGWGYFLHGWTSVMADVFEIEIPPRGPEFDALAELAAGAR